VLLVSLEGKNQVPEGESSRKVAGDRASVGVGVGVGVCVGDVKGLELWV
jgi:hypothetical protein